MSGYDKQKKLEKNKNSGGVEKKAPSAKKLPQKAAKQPDALRAKKSKAKK